jgi:hypothetical protein
MGALGKLLHWFFTSTDVNPDDPVDGTDDPVDGTDDQTGETYRLAPETPFARVVASVVAVYLIGMLAFLLWLLFDTWAGRNTILTALGYKGAVLTSPTFRLMAYVAIGGALGGTIDALRSLISWHAQQRAYGVRFVWKDLSLPLAGATLGLFAYITVKGGAGVFNGDFTLDPKGGEPTIAAFAVAALAGFSATQVYRWLDDKANKLFSITKPADTTIVPNLAGKTADEAAEVLKRSKLKLGSRSSAAGGGEHGKVLKQSLAPGAEVATQQAVDITVAVNGAPVSASVSSSLSR